MFPKAAYKLIITDEFCTGCSESGPCISREVEAAWGTLRDIETRQYLPKKMSVLRQLCIYLNPLGIDSYVPRTFTYKSSYVSHIMDDGEIATFFRELDADSPAPKNNGSNQRLNFEMKILFKMIYCCGLRVSETTHIKLEDIDFETETVAIYHSKDRKDRLVYCSDGMKNLIRQYHDILWNKYGVRSQLLFPAQDTGKFFQNASVGQKFNKIWERTAYTASLCTKAYCAFIKTQFRRQMDILVE